MEKQKNLKKQQKQPVQRKKLEQPVQKQKPEPKKPQRSPNLLNTAVLPKIKTIEKHHPKISSAAKLLIIFAQVLFVAALGFNSKLVNDIASLQHEVRNLENKIIEKKGRLATIEETITKTKRLKQLESERFELTESIEGAIGLIPDQIEIVRTLTKKDTFELVIETDTALEASVLMSIYLDKDVAKEIVLKSANLSSSSDKFTTGLEIRFK
jgi:hypothetical protein